MGGVRNLSEVGRLGAVGRLEPEEGTSEEVRKFGGLQVG